MALGDFADLLVEALPATAGGVRVSGPRGATVRRVAVMGGSGDDQFDAARASGADVYVTADLRHHPVLEAREEARDGTPVRRRRRATGRWSRCGWPRLASSCSPALGEQPTTGAAPTRVEGRLSGLRTEPWTFVAGANRARPEPGGVS